MSVFLSESDAKVRLIFETAKCFAIFFAKKCIFVQLKGVKTRLRVRKCAFLKR